MRKLVNIIAVSIAAISMCACSINAVPADTEESTVNQNAEDEVASEENAEAEKSQEKTSEDEGTAAAEGEGDNKEDAADLGESSEESESEETAKEASDGEAAESEEEAKKDSVEGIANNNSYFVGVDGKIYFRAHSEKALGKSVLWDNFLSSASGESFLYSYNIKTGRTEELCCFENAVGELFVFENNIICRSRDKKGNECLSAYSLEKGELLDEMDLGIEHFAGVSNNGRFMITYDWVYDNEPAYLHVYSNMNHVIGDFETETFSGIIGMKDDILFYEYYERANSEDPFEEGYYGIMQLNVRTGESVDLGTFPEVPYGSGELDQVLITDDKLYVGYGIYDGTGHFYQEGYLVSATIGEKNSASSEAFELLEGDNIPEKCPSFYVDDSGECVVCEGVPNTSGLVDEKIGYFDGAGKFVETADGYGWIMDEEDESVVSIEQSTMLYGKIFAIRDYLNRYPSEDIGWRYAYKRSGFDVVVLDPDTKKEENIMSVGTKPEQ